MQLSMLETEMLIPKNGERVFDFNDQSTAD